MKQKIVLTAEVPNVSRVKSRLVETPANFTLQMREIVSKAAAIVLNKNILQMRMEIIRMFDEAGFQYKPTVSGQDYRIQLTNLLEPFFDVVVVAADKDIVSVEKPFGTTDKEPETPEEVVSRGESISPLSRVRANAPLVEDPASLEDEFSSSTKVKKEKTIKVPSKSKGGNTSKKKAPEIEGSIPVRENEFDLSIPVQEQDYIKVVQPVIDLSDDNWSE